MNYWILNILAMTAYLVAASMQGLTLSGRGFISKWPWFSGGAAAICVHAILLYHLIDITRGQNLTYINVFTFIMWMISLLIIVLSLYKPVESLSIVIFPLASVSILLAIAFPGQRILATSTDPKQFIHIWLAVLAFSVLCIAGLQAGLIALQERCLRLKQIGSILQSLPPLETMETLLFQTILLGFLLLTAVIVSSMAAFNNIFAPPLLHQTVLAILAWLIFGMLLWGRYYFGWRGRVAISWTIIGVVILVISYFGSALVFP